MLALVPLTDTESRDRRGSERRTANVAAEVHLPSGSVPLRTASLSASGLSLSSPHVPAVGTALHLTLHLPDGPLECVAIVVRAAPGIGMGCRISVPGLQERRRWRCYLESLPRELLLSEQEYPEDPRELFDFTWRNDGGAEPWG